MTLITNRARAYVNWGRWVADCPTGCGGALQLNPGMATFACVECKAISEIEWPPHADDIMSALEERPAPKNRNWFPSGHSLALRSNSPHGQTVKELYDETRENQ
jgi:hypothetical protein